MALNSKRFRQEYELKLKDEEFRQKLGKSKTELTDLGDRGVGAFSKMKAGMLAVIAVAGIFITQIGSAIKEYITLSDKQVKADKKVEQAIISTGKAAGFTAKELKKMASEYQEALSIGDEDILNNVTAQLLTFTGIQEEQFVRAQEAVINIATVLDSDLKPVALQVGKALNDPIANLGALGRAGIQFTLQQKVLVKELVKTNQLAEAQRLILDELERQYGGQALAVSKALGAVGKFQNSIGDLKEALGDVLRDALQPYAKGIKETAEAMSAYIRQSPAEKLEEERVTLNSLVTAISLTNDNQELRNSLIDELQEKYPEFLKNLSDEQITNETLAERLKATNEQMLARVVIQKALAEQKELIEEQAEAWIKQNDAVVKLSGELGRLAERYNVDIAGAKNQTEALDLILEAMNEKLQAQGVSAEQVGRIWSIYANRIQAIEIGHENYVEATNKVLKIDEQILELKRKLGIANENVAKTNHQVAEGYEQLAEFEEAEIDNLDAQLEKQAELETKRVKAIQDRIKAGKVSKKVSEDFAKEIESRIKKFEDETKASKKTLASVADDEERKVDLLHDLGRITTEAYIEELTLRADTAKQFYGQDSIEYLQALKTKEDALENFEQTFADKAENMEDLAKGIGSALSEGFETGKLKDSLKAVLVLMLDFLEKLVLAGQVGAGARALVGDFSGLAQIAVVKALFEGAKVAIQSFRTGVENFEGGPVKLHKDEETYLPKGSTVITKSEVERKDRLNAERGSQQIVEKLDELIAVMSTLNLTIGVRELNSALEKDSQNLL